MEYKIEYFETIESTNDYLKTIDKESGYVVISNEQTKGKGRLGRIWSSNKNEGLYMSILLKPNLSIDKIPFLTMITGSVIIKVLNSLGINSQIKWPNDIILNNKKIGGILSELVTTNDDKKVIIGIGINLNKILFEDDIKDKATSLKYEGFEIEKDLLIKNILTEFNILYSDYIDNLDTFSTIKIHRENSVLINKNVYVIKNNQKELVKCIDINEKGNLIIKKDNEIIEINSGEVSIRGEHGYI